jgi:glycosyltransferase involved in cell wall biosynthesis
MLSICIPTKDRLEHLRALLGSLVGAAACCPFDFEVVVLDNASDDWLDEEEVSFYAQKIRFKFIRHACNIGFPGNYLAALHEASQEWIWILGDDDIYDFVGIFGGIKAALVASQALADPLSLSLIHINQSQFREIAGRQIEVKANVHECRHTGLLNEDEFLDIVSNSLGGVLFVASNVLRMASLAPRLNMLRLHSNQALCMCTPLIASSLGSVFFLGEPLIQNRLGAPWSSWPQGFEMAFRVDVPLAILESRNMNGIYKLLISKISLKAYAKVVMIAIASGDLFKAWRFSSTCAWYWIKCLFAFVL